MYNRYSVSEIWNNAGTGEKELTKENRLIKIEKCLCNFVEK